MADAINAARCEMAGDLRDRPCHIATSCRAFEGCNQEGHYCGCHFEGYVPEASLTAAQQEIERLEHEVIDWKLACGQRDEDTDKDVLTIVRERDAERARAETAEAERDKWKRRALAKLPAVTDFQELRAERDKLREALALIVPMFLDEYPASCSLRQIVATWGSGRADEGRLAVLDEVEAALTTPAPVDEEER